MPAAAVPARPDTLEELHGLIERVTFQNAETGFAVLQVQVRGQRDLVTVLGTLPEVQAGEWAEAQGRWVIDREHGRQFRSVTLRTAPPNTAEGMKKYLGSGLVKGIGPALAGRLVDAFGVQVFEVIEQTPERLLEVGGIGKGRQRKITGAWNDQKQVREIMVFLHGHGVSTSRAFRIYKKYGEEAIQRVREDPYRLARDIWGIGFKTADQIAERLGIGRHSDLRARAGVEFVLHELTEQGHCAYPRADLSKKAQAMLGIPPQIIEAAVEHGLAERRLVEGDDGNGTALVYLAPYEAAERRLAENLRGLAAGNHPCPPVDVPKAVAWVEQQIGFPLAAAQREALGLAVRSKVMVITGGPGVGKTTLLNSVVKVLAAKGLDVVLCAPTGRAAKRVAETTGREAKTVHRLLEFDPSGGGFKRQQDNPLEGDVFVIDEASMVDLMLAHQFVRAVPPHAALIIVGDVDQLPSVGPGNVLRDIIDSGAVPVCRLTEVFRQAAASAIVTNAHRINHGQMPQFPQGRVADVRQSDFYFFPADEPEQGLKEIVRLLKEAIPRSFGFDPLRDVQVLTPMQRGELGARNLNLLLQQALNPSGPGDADAGRDGVQGDRRHRRHVGGHELQPAGQAAVQRDGDGVPRAQRGVPGRHRHRGPQQRGAVGQHVDDGRGDGDRDVHQGRQGREAHPAVGGDPEPRDDGAPAVFAADHRESRLRPAGNQLAEQLFITGDRYRDVSDEVRSAVLEWLAARAVAPHLLELVREGGRLEAEEQRVVFGEALPRGLRIE